LERPAVQRDQASPDGFDWGERFFVVIAVVAPACPEREVLAT
jgi:hypothetical protein